MNGGILPKDAEWTSALAWKGLCETCLTHLHLVKKTCLLCCRSLWPSVQECGPKSSFTELRCFLQTLVYPTRCLQRGSSSSFWVFGMEFWLHVGCFWRALENQGSFQDSVLWSALSLGMDSIQIRPPPEPRWQKGGGIKWDCDSSIWNNCFLESCERLHVSLWPPSSQLFSREAQTVACIWLLKSIGRYSWSRGLFAYIFAADSCLLPWWTVCFCQ